MNLPNKLTVIRILLIPLFMLVFLHVLQSRILLMVKLRDAISW